MYEYYDAVLHAVTEGLLLIDLDGRLRMANDEAVRLLGLPDGAQGRPVSELGLAPPLVAALTDPEPREDELHVTDARVLVLNTAPAQWQGQPLGFVAAARPDRPRGPHGRARLGPRAHRGAALAGPRVRQPAAHHRVPHRAGARRAGLAFATEELAASQVLTDRVVASVEEPALSALLLGKAAQAAERGSTSRSATAPAGRRGAAPGPRHRDHRGQPRRQRLRRRRGW